MPAQPAWKERLGPALMRGLGEAVRAELPLDLEGWLADLDAAGLYDQELMSRVQGAAAALGPRLPAYAVTVPALIRLAPRVQFWENLVLCAYVQQHGLDDPDTSIGALRALTPHGTCEFAIRPYINQHMERMLVELAAWTQDPDEHVRRLAAEGTRPRGVWMEHIPAFRADPRPVLALLERLRADPSLYVRKAVANNLNDISKDHPELALSTARRWLEGGDPRTAWIVNRGLRTLLKSGDAEAHQLLGRPQGLDVEVARFALSPTDPRIGEEIVLSTTLRNASDEPVALILSYRLHFARPGGKAASKVFQWTRRELAAGEALSLQTRQALRDLSTRRHHPGAHRVDLLINGVPAAEAGFTLRPAS